MSNRKKNLLLLTLSVLLWLGAPLLYVACQPKTVVVERIDDELIPIEEPLTSPIIVVDQHTTIQIDSYNYKQYKLVDLREKEICRVLQVNADISLTCRAMTPNELEEWK